MFIPVKNYSYIAASAIIRHDDDYAEYRTANGEMAKAKLTTDGTDALEIWSKKFIEVSDKNENTTIIPIETITSIRRLGPQQQYCSVGTTSGETFYLNDELYKMLLKITLLAHDYAEVP